MIKKINLLYEFSFKRQFCTCIHIVQIKLDRFFISPLLISPNNSYNSLYSKQRASKVSLNIGRRDILYLIQILNIIFRLLCTKYLAFVILFYCYILFAFLYPLEMYEINSCYILLHLISPQSKVSKMLKS